MPPVKNRKRNPKKRFGFLGFNGSESLPIRLRTSNGSDGDTFLGFDRNEYLPPRSIISNASAASNTPLADTDFTGFEVSDFRPQLSSTQTTCTLGNILTIGSVLAVSQLAESSTISSIQQSINEGAALSHTFQLPQQFLENSLDDIPPPCFIEDEDDDIPDYIMVYGGTQRDRDVVVDSNGYEYTLKQINSAGAWWRCPVRNKRLQCFAVYKPGRVDKHGIPIDPRGVNKLKHKCPKKHRPEEIRKLRRDLKREGLLHLLSTAKSIVKKGMNSLKLSDEEQKLMNMPSELRLSAQVNYYRIQVRPQQISTLNFVMNHSCIPEGFLKEDIHIDTDTRHVIFATSHQLKYLQNAVTWYVDGTFKIVKKPFVQMFSIHVFVKSGLCHAQIPVAFVMMSGRSSPDYVSVFKALMGLVPQAKVGKIVLDFERAVWSALYGMMSRDEFPQVTIKGCFFHFAQAVFRKIQNLGLKTSYVKDLGTKDICRRMMSLPLLPEQCVEAEFRHLNEKCDESGIEALQRFGEYMRKNWIEGWFNPATWVCFYDLVRTNNHVEGYHRGLNSRVNGAHVNFYCLVQVLHEEALSARTRAIEVEMGIFTTAQARPEKKRNEDLKQLWEKLIVHLQGGPAGMTPRRFLANASKKTDDVSYDWDQSRNDLDGEDDV